MEDERDDTEARERVGTTVGGRWRFDAVIGVGGMGAVFRATNVEVESEVALKVLLRRFARNDEVRQRFQAEGRIANKIQHPGVVKILDAGVTDDGCPYLVMEHLRGETLQSRWEARGYRLDPREALALVQSLLDVMVKAHEAGVVHRDIKPDNVFLTEGGGVKVLDFGIARLHEAAQAAPRRRGKTRIGMPMGTAGFMAPEQATGQWDSVDARTDLWAVGATLFALLAGETVDELPGGGLGPVPSIRTRLPALDPRVADVVDRALAHQPGDRWPDAATMRAEIGGALAGLPETMAAPAPIEAGPPAAKTVPGAPLGVDESAVRRGDLQVAPTARNKKTVVAALVLGVVMAGGGVVAISRGPRTRGVEVHEAEGGPPPVTTLMSDAEASAQPSSRPVVEPVVTATPVGPHYDGSACADDGGAVWEKHCGKCVTLGRPETGCKLGTCRPCDLPNAVADCPKPGKPQRCVVGACKAGFGDCNRSDDDGCEVDLRASTESCGRCGNRCAGGDHASPACSEGACKLACDPDFADCDRRPANGCEVNTKTSLANCGACGNACKAAANQEATCGGGACAASCKAGFGDCNGNAADGCEVNVKTSTAHCGTCGNACRAGANQEAACRGGACAAACHPGFADCNGNAADGCETDVRKDEHNCGGCGKSCAAPTGGSVSCEAGRCKPHCAGSATFKPDINACVEPPPPPPPAEVDAGAPRPPPPAVDGGGGR
jgi:eukaryotic-like serine/threonine-protein kinase